MARRSINSDCILSTQNKFYAKSLQLGEKCPRTHLSFLLSPTLPCLFEPIRYLLVQMDNALAFLNKLRRKKLIINF